MEETSISASAFMAGLVANLTYEKRDKIRYSKHKFVKTRAKIASVIYRATQNEADFDFYTQAYEHFIRCTLLERVERHRYDEDTGSEVDWIRFMCRSLLDRFDKVIILTSGSLTDWGRSVWRPVLVFACIVAFFTVYYAVAIGISPLSPWRDLRRAVVTATNITLVAGYDAQYQKAFPGLCNWAGFLTLLWACFGIP